MSNGNNPARTLTREQKFGISITLLIGIVLLVAFIFHKNLGLDTQSKNVILLFSGFFISLSAASFLSALFISVGEIVKDKAKIGGTAAIFFAVAYVLFQGGLNFYNPGKIADEFKAKSGAAWNLRRRHWKNNWNRKLLTWKR